MYGFKIMVTGDYACFTRPELKVERISYDVPTPGALEGMLKSIYWKPAIRYYIDRVIVFNPINFVNVRRNEVKDKVSYASVKANMKGGSNDLCIYADESRNQRATMLLKDVRYGIEFHFELTGIKSEQERDAAKKHYNIIKRRLENGQQFRTPCLGCSEFPVKTIGIVEEFPMDEISPEIIAMGDVDLGYMLYRMEFADGGNPINGDWEAPTFSDRADARYYRPQIAGGVIDVKKYAEGIRC